MNIHNSYFAFPNFSRLIAQYIHPCRFKTSIDFHGQPLSISWTKRAEQALKKRYTPLIVEMQIYFSCVVQKRVLFHEKYTHETLIANDLLHVALRPVQAESCDPVEFANHHPVALEYASTAAQKFRPSKLRIDHRDGSWHGEFDI